jgi:hypothetical protein
MAVRAAKMAVGHAARRWVKMLVVNNRGLENGRLAGPRPDRILARAGAADRCLTRWGTTFRSAPGTSPLFRLVDPDLLNLLKWGRSRAIVALAMAASPKPARSFRRVRGRGNILGAARQAHGQGDVHSRMAVGGRRLGLALSRSQFRRF